MSSSLSAPSIEPVDLAHARRGARVLGTFIDALDDSQSVERIARWASARESRTVCLCNAHSVVTATRDADHFAALAAADLVLPDGAPVAWMLRRSGFAGQPRVSGPDLVLQLCEGFQHNGTSVFLYGSTPETLAKLRSMLAMRFPGLRIVGAISPPFGLIDDALDRRHVEEINRSGAGALFVGLGCPRQEKWLQEHRGSVQAVALGVGAAFDFHAGTITRAPQWMRRSGLEWLHRLISEPRRLGRRYLVTNTLFIAGAAKQLIRRGPNEPRR